MRMTNSISQNIGPLRVTLSKSGISMSSKVNKNTRITKKANGKYSVSVNLGNGLRWTKQL
jgi:hypothetical protein